MEKSRKFLKYSAIASIIYGLTFLNNSIISLIILIIGFILYGYSESENLLSKKTVLIILTVIQMLINPIIGLLLILSLNELERERAYKAMTDTGTTQEIKKEEINPESKKIDLLLKLGVGMVFISIILFATTSWYLITDVIKLIALVLLGTIFLCLSVFTEKRLKIKKTSVMYWFLSMSFYFAIIIGICYFSLLGPELSYFGKYKDLMYGVTSIFASIISVISYVKYKKTSLLYLTYLFLYIGIKELIIGIAIPEAFACLITVFISILINLIFEKDYAISKFNNILSYYLIYESFKIFNTDYKTLLSIITILNMLNITFISKKSNNQLINIITTICDYFLIYIALFTYQFEYVPIYIMLLTTLLHSTIKYGILYDSKETRQLSDISYLISTMILIMISLFYREICPLVVSSIYLIFNTINLLLKRQEEIDHHVMPLTILLEGFSLGYFINNISNVFEVKYSIIFLLISLFYCVIITYINNEKKKIYTIYTLVAVGLTMLSNIGSLDVLVQIISLLPLNYVFFTNNNELANKDFLSGIYIFILVDIYFSIVICGLLDLPIIINILITLIIYILLLYSVRKNEKLVMITNFANLIPLFHAICIMDYSFINRYVLINMLEFYALYLLLKYICKKNSDREILSIIGTIFILIQIFFFNEAIVGLYVGIIGIILIFTGFYNREYEKLFIVGILVTIANILYQLRELWSQIPFYLYLLIGGLGIIAFVTYKEIKNSRK